VTEGLLPLLSATYGRGVTAEELFAFAYAVLATPSYVRHFWEELRNPGPRLPVPKDGKLFLKMADTGRELVWLHTFGERFVPVGKRAGEVPPGKAKCLVGTPTAAAHQAHGACRQGALRRVPQCGSTASRACRWSSRGSATD
jgi:hypothetical protein